MPDRADGAARAGGGLRGRQRHGDEGDRLANLPGGAGRGPILGDQGAGRGGSRRLPADGKQRLALGKKAGISLNPATPAKTLDYLIDDIDLVLIMSVNPGFGGQSFISNQLRKIEAVRKMIDKTGRTIHLEVDGGIDTTTAPLAISAGADVLVAGTASFKGGADHYAANIAALKNAG